MGEEFIRLAVLAASAVALLSAPARADDEEVQLVRCEQSLGTAAPQPAADAAAVRSLRAGTQLVPTGNREGLWIEAEDNFGTRGWVSVEDLG